MSFLENTLKLSKSISPINEVLSLPIAIFVGITLGVIGKYFYDYSVMYFKSPNKKSVVWDWKGFGITVVLSGIIGFLLYGFVFERVSKLNDLWLVFSASGQAGFFSQSIIGELGKEYK